MIYEKFARLFCETDWLNLQLDSVDRLVDQVEATEDQQVLLDQEDQLVRIIIDFIWNTDCVSTDF